MSVVDANDNWKAFSYNLSHLVLQKQTKGYNFTQQPIITVYIVFSHLKSSLGPVMSYSYFIYNFTFLLHLALQPLYSSLFFLSKMGT